MKDNLDLFPEALKLYYLFNCEGSFCFKTGVLIFNSSILLLCDYLACASSLPVFMNLSVNG